MNYDAYGNPIKPKSSGVVVPLLLALLLSGAGNYWLWKERAKAMGDAYTATAKLTAAEAVQKEAAEKIEKLETERTGLIEAKEQAVKDAQARALELAKLKDDVAGVEVTKEPPPDTDKKGAKPDAKDDKKADKKADEKAETRPSPKAKTKPKAKKSAAGSSHKSKKAGGDDEPPAQHEL
jgi:outer membrane biosynthesis protein TonB